jgi:hypothetical protein
VIVRKNGKEDESNGVYVMMVVTDGELEEGISRPLRAHTGLLGAWADGRNIK